MTYQVPDHSWSLERQKQIQQRSTFWGGISGIYAIIVGAIFLACYLQLTQPADPLHGDDHIYFAVETVIVFGLPSILIMALNGWIVGRFYANRGSLLTRTYALITSSISTTLIIICVCFLAFVILPKYSPTWKEVVQISIFSLAFILAGLIHGEVLYRDI